MELSEAELNIVTGTFQTWRIWQSEFEALTAATKPIVAAKPT